MSFFNFAITILLLIPIAFILCVILDIIANEKLKTNLKRVRILETKRKNTQFYTLQYRNIFGFWKPILSVNFPTLEEAQEELSNYLNPSQNKGFYPQYDIVIKKFEER